MTKKYEMKALNPEGKIYIGIPRERLYIPAFVDNRDQILMTLQKKGMSCGYFQADGHRVDRNRDRIVEHFLDLPEKPDWLLMLDSDMDHPRDIGIRLAKWGKPIVAGLYFGRQETHDPFIFRDADPEKDKYGRMRKLWAPMREEVFKFLTDNQVPMMDGALTIDDAIGSPLVECDAVATGTMLIHRSVLETMKQPIFEYREGGQSEDMQFCWEAKHDYGIPIYCDLSTISGHYVFQPVGQAQFRLIYQKRGMNFSGYTKKEAAELVAEFYGITEEAALAKIEKGNASMVGDYWVSKFRDKEPTLEEIEEFYKDQYTGDLYLIELLHWNFNRTFYNLKSLFTGLRNQTVLEIGSGIGSLAIQLAVQGCDVVAVEPNKVLSDFSKLRVKKLEEQIATELGQIEFVEGFIVDDEEIYDTVVSTDTFEHLPETVIPDLLKDIAKSLKSGGSLIYHANFKQQDLYPMHFDHSEKWDSWLIEAGFTILSPSHAIKGK
jgi:2-polyprenyl-3-methyl-5-hydroxy-6-metoxy-1,4-benzoquinol methylase